MSKENLKYLSILIISVIVSSLASVGALSTMYDGTEVSYDNSSTHIAATDVQGAIDQVYASATDYSNINSRLQTIENLFPAFETTSTHTIEHPFVGNGINLGKYSATNDIWFDIYHSGKIQASINPLSTGGVAIRGWKDGSSLQGDVQLLGKNIVLTGSSSITIDGADVKNVSSGNLTITSTYTKTTSTSYVKYHKWGKIVIVTVNDICPKANAASGTYTIATGLPNAAGEVVTTVNPNTSGSTAAYRVRVNGNNLQWNWVTGASDSCPYAAGEIIYFAS